MRILFITLILCSVFINAPAQAKSSWAKSSWKVKEVTLDDNTPPYCSMRNYYRDSNVSLILSEDAEENISFAIDFLEPVLETNREYALTFQIIGKLQKRIVSNAASKTILVSQIGQDTHFLDSLGRGEKLNIKMDGVNLNFKLSGTLKSIKKLEKCVTNLPLPKIQQVQNNIPQPKKSFVTVTKPIEKKMTETQAIQTPIQDEQIQMETILKSALNISDINTSHKVEGVYSWKIHDLFGNAQIFPWPKGQSFSDMIDHYIEKTKTRCNDSFASQIGQSLSLSGGQVYSVADVACVGSETNNAAAIFFHGNDNKFLVVSHEGASSQLREALLLRDRVSTHFLSIAK